MTDIVIDQTDGGIGEFLTQFAELEFQQIVEDRIPLSAPCRVTPATLENILKAAIRAKVAMGVRGESIHCFRDQQELGITFGCALTPTVKARLLEFPLEKSFGVIRRTSTVADTSFDGIVVLDDFRDNARLQQMIDRRALLQNCTTLISERLLQAGTDLQLLAAAMTQLPTTLHEAHPFLQEEVDLAIALAQWWIGDFFPASRESFPS